MSKSKIHPLAVVESGAQIGHNVTVEAYAVIKKDVTLEDDVVIKSHAYIDGYTTVGEGTKIFPGASIGTKPQALSFRGEQTRINIGRHCEIREYVTINASIQEGACVEIGDHTMIMTHCHIAHNCHLGSHVIMGNCSHLGGHVVLEDYAIVGGMTPVHQWVRIGRYAMVGGLSRVSHDVPPYTIGAGIPFKIGGLNLIGLKRHGFSLETRSELTKAFRLIYRSKLHYEEAIARCEADLQPIPEVQHWLRFCRETKRGLIGLQGVASDMMVPEEAGALQEAAEEEEDLVGTLSSSQ